MSTIPTATAKPRTPLSSVSPTAGLPWSTVSMAKTDVFKNYSVSTSTITISATDIISKVPIF